MYEKGYQIITASTGANGLLLIDKMEFDLIITDINMPSISGNRVLDVSKNKNHNVPVIAMSGTPWMIKDKLFDGILYKPFSSNELLKIIASLKIAKR